MGARYRIEDEPRPAGLAGGAVSPVWPLLSLMLGGAWAAWPWFAINGMAIGSATRIRELLWLAGGVIGSAAIGLAIIALTNRGTIDGASLPYVGLLLQAWKLAVAYGVFTIQSRSHQLHEHYGGVSRNGIGILILAALLRGRVVKLVDLDLWILVVA
jgi:hypothetical protein